MGMSIEQQIEEYKLKCSLLGIEALDITIEDGEVVADTTECLHETIDIPKFVTKIADLAFASQTKLKSITLPEGLKEIGYEAFYKCEALEEITIPSKIKVLDPSLFAFCTNLRKVTIKADDIFIDQSVFHKCVMLNEVNILGGHVKIGKGAFVKFSRVYTNEHKGEKQLYIQNLNIDCESLELGEWVFGNCFKIRAPKRFKEVLIHYKNRVELY